MTNNVFNKTTATSIADGSFFYVISEDGTEEWKATLTLLASEIGGGAVEGTAVLSTGETVGKVLQADGDDSSSWVALGGGGDA
jgi:hypothetical protein